MAYVWIFLVLIIVGVKSQNSTSTGDNAANLGQELANLDFDSIIGGPLLAAVNAQAQAAATTIDFINRVGFKKGADNSTQIAMVSFGYQLPGNGTSGPIQAQMNIPALTLFPIPYIEISEIILDFNVKLNSVSNSETSTSTDFSGSSSSSGGTQGVNFQAAISTQRLTRDNVKVQRDFSLTVHVRASAAPLPVGIQRILDQLDVAIQANGAPSGKK